MNIDKVKQFCTFAGFRFPILKSLDYLTDECPDGPVPAEGLLEKTKDLRRRIADSIDAGVSSLNGFPAMTKHTSRAPQIMKTVVEQVPASVAKSAAKEVGKGLLKGLFRR